MLFYELLGVNWLPLHENYYEVLNVNWLPLQKLGYPNIDSPKLSIYLFSHQHILSLLHQRSGDSPYPSVTCPHGGDGCNCFPMHESPANAHWLHAHCLPSPSMGVKCVGGDNVWYGAIHCEKFPQRVLAGAPRKEVKLPLRDVAMLWCCLFVC